MSETIRLILTKFTDETITVFSMLLILTMASIVVYWFYNRKKFHQLSHEIPASVVKNYLDSIIQNSTALKSSLFRGGGLELGNGIPSVVPVGDLPSSMNISVGSSSEEVNQKNAEIASLSQKLNDRNKQITDLEKRMQDVLASSGKGGAETEILKKEISTLQTQLAEAKSAGAGDPNIAKELQVTTNERNELRERLKEYEIIEEDLANLKRLQQENDQLKAELNSLKKGAPAAPKVEPMPSIPTPMPEPILEPEPEMEMDLEAEMARAIAESKAPTKPAPEAEVAEVPEVDGEQKSAEELLSEFEKMLG